MHIGSLYLETILYSKEFSIEVIDEVTLEKINVKLECGMLDDRHWSQYYRYICVLSPEPYGSMKELVLCREINPDTLPFPSRLSLRGKEDMSKIKKIVDEMIQDWKSGKLVMRNGRRYVNHNKYSGKYRSAKINGL